MHTVMLKYVLVGLLLLSGCGRVQTPDATTSRPRSNAAQRSEPNETKPRATADSSASPHESLGDSSGLVAVEGITLNVPANWESKPPASSIIAAEFVLPRADGDDADGRLTISTAGGSVEANIDRWRGQFDPQPQDASQEEIDVAGLRITIVDLSGDFNDQRGPFAPPVKRPSYRMIAAVIPGEGQLHFIKATGPQKTMDKHAEAIHRFIRSIQPAK